MTDLRERRHWFSVGFLFCLWLESVVWVIYEILKAKGILK